MKTILIFPTHRKIVALLKEHIASGGHLEIIQEDVDDFHHLMQRTQIALGRHKGIYRILLRIMNRNRSDSISVNDDVTIISHIENAFARAERKRLDITIRNTVLRPLILKLLKLFDHDKNDSNQKRRD